MRVNNYIKAKNSKFVMKEFSIMIKNEYLADTLIDTKSEKNTCPIWLIKSGTDISDLSKLSSMQKEWLKNTGWKASTGNYAILPDHEGTLSGVIYVCESANEAQFKLGNLPKKLPTGNYHLESELEDIEKHLIGWVLDSYNYDNYKSDVKPKQVSIKIPKNVNKDRVLKISESVCIGRNLINTPANDLGPEEIEQAARQISSQHNAEIEVITGESLIKQNFPLIHAVGRASPRAPRLIDIRWRKNNAPGLTLIGKGICFDTGGLNIKPGNSMRLMKKDMGGAATVLALGNMIMSLGLEINLRILIPTAENSISGNAFRPGDVLPSRNGMSVEIGNTDAEGRLVLADAMTYATEEATDHLMTFATLTGAARVALGSDLPPFYTTDDDFASRLQTASMQVNDPLWRMPFWAPYDAQLKSKIADISHISDSGFAGSITAALFLKRFAKKAKQYTHLDIYGWVPKETIGKTYGGEPQGARAVLDVLEKSLIKN